MSSNYLANSNAFRPSSHRVLVVLKTRGPQRADQLGEVLGITVVAVRQHMMKLAAEGLVTVSSEPQGVGRPVQFWSLTDEGNARFPDAHADLTVDLIHTMRMHFGATALERLIEARAVKSLVEYTKALEGAVGLQEKVACLAGVRSREGYMAEWRAEGDEFVLVENHCAICTAATACQELCNSQLDIFRKILGEGVSVERTEHIASGDRRCAY